MSKNTTGIYIYTCLLPMSTMHYRLPVGTGQHNTLARVFGGKQRLSVSVRLHSCLSPCRSKFSPLRQLLCNFTATTTHCLHKNQVVNFTSTHQHSLRYFSSWSCFGRAWQSARATSGHRLLANSTGWQLAAQNTELRRLALYGSGQHH